MTKKATTTKTLTIHLVLDRSGSMASCRENTIKAVQGYIKEVAKSAPKSTISITTFDDQSFDTPIDGVLITKAKFKDTDFVPRGMTPLYDAIAYSVGKLGEVKADHKALVIVTDGYENASKEFDAEQIKKLLAKAEKDGWLVVYLGANQDAIAVGAAMGTNLSNTMTFDTGNVGSTMTSTARATSVYSQTGSAEGAAFTPAERKKATEKSK